MNRNYLDTSRRNIERNFSTLDNKDLTIYILLASINNIALGITNISLGLISSFSLVYASQ
jgi:hypothetical protein